MLDIHLIRHAESELNKRPDLIGGRSNESPLSERGIRQAKLLGERLRSEGIVFDEIYSSTALRASSTSRVALEGTDHSEIIELDDLLELDQGDWEKKPRSEIYTPEILSRLTPEFRPPNGESQFDVEERMMGFLNRILMPKKDKDLVVGVFSHGMAIKCLLRGILEFDPGHTYKVVLDNTSITRLKYNRLGWHLVSVNDSAHLMGEEKIGSQYS